METSESILSMMRSVTSLSDLQLPASAVAIGAFDGVHLGHRRLLERTWLYAGLWNIPSVVITFDPLPSIFFGKTPNCENLMLPEEKIAMLEALGLDAVVTLPFTRQLAELSPSDFMTQVQYALHTKMLFVGTDFALGHHCEGTPARLAEIGQTLHYHVQEIPRLEMDGAVISSTRIRALLRSGDLREANRLLAYEYGFTSKVIHGDARGRRLGFPTINMTFPEQKLQIGRGVYVARLELEGRIFPAVTNVGIRPTFHPQDNQVVVESFLLEGGDDFYGDLAEISFVEKLRDEVVFPSVQALTAQIEQDIAHAKSILAL